MIDFSVDVFAFGRRHPEAKAFFTYAGYLKALTELIESEFGVHQPYPSIVSSLDRHGRLTRLGAKSYAGDEKPVTSLLINAWVSELNLYLTDLERG